MKTTKCRRKPNYKHIIEVCIIVIMTFLNKVVDMLDSSIEPRWLHYLLFFSICSLSIIEVELIARLIEELSLSIKTRKRRNNIKCYCNNNNEKHN